MVEFVVSNVSLGIIMLILKCESLEIIGLFYLIMLILTLITFSSQLFTKLNLLVIPVLNFLTTWNWFVLLFSILILLIVFVLPIRHLSIRILTSLQILICDSLDSSIDAHWHISDWHTHILVSVASKCWLVDISKVLSYISCLLNRVR